MNKFTRRFLPMLLLLLLALAGCTAPAAPTAETGAADDAAAAPFRIAVVMPSTATDLAWSQAIIDGIIAVQSEIDGGVEYSFSENMFNVTDAAAAIRDYASEGFDLVIAHGTQYGESMFEVAKDFPETSFAWGTAIDTGAERGLSNVYAYEANAQEGGYVSGVIAAALSEAGNIGVVGPVEAGDAKLYIDGFLNGVVAQNPDAETSVIYTGSFGDTALAAESANTLIQGGADVLSGSAQQVVGAIGVAKEQGVLWLGTQSDQSSLAPEIVVATQLYDWAPMLTDVITKIKAGELGGTAYVLTLENGGLKMVYSDGYALPDDVKALADAAIQGIIDGSIIPLSE